MTVLMVFGLMPAGVNLKDVKADEGTATVYFNLNAVTLTDGKFTIDTTTFIGDVPAIATLGSKNYEYICASNVAGTLTVTAPDGTVLPSVHMNDDFTSYATIAKSVMPGITEYVTENTEPDPTPAPVTGDSTNIWLYVILIAVAVCVVVIALVVGRKKNRK